jgi:CspA family cold shock protein
MSKQGTVKWFNATKGFGFIACEDKDIFVHISAVEAAGLRQLNEGETVMFETQDGAKGPSAVNISVK